MSDARDARYMARALRLAGRGLYTTDPNPRVGCVLVRGDEIVGEGWHERAGGPHAELEALREAGDRAPGATAYVTLEPCAHYGRTPPCSDALLRAGVARLVVAMVDPNPLVAGQGIAKLRDAGIETESGLMAEQAEALNRGFLSRMRSGRPWVRVKTAMSLDGRTAMASGESQWITGEAARRDVQHLRARSSAVLTGVGTVLADDPSLNVRLTAAELGIVEPVRHPLRVVLDSELRTPTDAKMLALPGQMLILTTSQDAARIDTLRESGAEVAQVEGSATGLDLQAVMETLAVREVNEVHVEAGATLTGALLAEGLVHELVVYMAAHLMGDGARGLARLPAISTMSDRIDLRFTEVRFVGPDLRMILHPTGSGKE
jgi:diaminohydroxyphosphoribosylaminopyrimidine deaminase/5-amino-6-(5-phosphoribosylamino)uracil reductase